MDNKNELQDFDLDDILNEFHDLPEEDAQADAADVADQALREELEELDHLLEELPEATPVTVPQASVPEVPAVEEVTGEETAAEKAEDGAPIDTIRMNQIIAELTEDSGEKEKSLTEDATIRLDTLPGENHDAEKEVSDDATVRMEPVLEEVSMEDLEREVTRSLEETVSAPKAPIQFSPRAQLRELKKKLVAGPEKRYYELSEIGVGPLQLALLLNLGIVALCVLVTTLYTLNLIPENRLRLVIFSQVLAMLLSALLGCNQMLDGLGELFKGRFTLNTLLSITFAACCADAVFCLSELRVPCCAAFSLEVSMALWARLQRRSTEMSQMDTLRKAVRLHSLVKEPGYFDGKAGILRSQGQVEDFMDNYNRSSGPEKLQSIYAFVSFLLCIAIAVFAGLNHGLSMALQILSTSLLVAVPASFFIALTRPAAVLERRLHMVGTVLCGWQGVKKLCGKAAFPLRDEDLFPLGSTKLNGVKFYGDRDPDEVIAYTTSLISVAGGGLVPVFRQLLAGRDGTELPVAHYQSYGSGGIGGEIKGESVLLGTLNFLQDMGVEIPEGTMVNQAVYASIDGELCAVFAIAYAKMRSSAAGMVTLCAHKHLTPVLTGGDYMINEGLLRSKFGVNTKRIAFPAPETREELNAHKPDPAAPALAIFTRDELVSAAYAVTGARALRSANVLGVVIHLIGGILGLLIMAVLAYLGATELLTPTHVLLYQLVWLVPGLLVTEWTRTV